MNIKFYISVVLLFLCLIPAGALEISDGLIKVILHENIGRFSLYYLTDADKKTYTALFTDQDPRTTSLSIAVNNKVYSLGDSISFRESLEKTSTGARFTWKSSQLEVTQDFSFVKSVSASQSDGIKLTLKFTNKSDEELKVRARLILDTSLGEEQSAHFFTDSISGISSEMKLESSNMEEYWVSPKNDKVGLMMYTGAQAVTNPDMVIFANWKRLNDTSWSYASSSGRNFNLPPYSINDSAVCHYYYPDTLESGRSVEIEMVMGNYTKAGFFRAPVSTPAPETTATDSGNSNQGGDNSNNSKDSPAGTGNDSSSSTPVVTIDPVVLMAVKGDISTLDTLLEEIDNKLSAGSYTEKDLELLEKIISELDEKADNYSQDQ